MFNILLQLAKFFVAFMKTWMNKYINEYHICKTMNEL